MYLSKESGYQIRQEVEMSVRLEDISDMINLAMDVVKKYGAEGSIKVFENLDDWANSGADISPFQLRKIALELNGEIGPTEVYYDKDVQSNIGSIFSSAVQTGIYNTELVKAGVKTRRGYKILRDLASYTIDPKEFDITKYVSDEVWSDTWIDRMRFCSDIIGRHIAFGYNLMEVFTPQHNPHTFYEVCYHLKDEDQYRISLEWLRDSHWTGSAARRLVYLYMYKPGYDWSKFLRPWLCIWAGSEMEELESKDDTKNLAVLNKWIHVSPLLEHCIDNYIPDCDAKGWDYVYKTYDILRDRYGCDGDDLAQQLQHIGNVPTEVLQRNTYYNESVKEWVRSGIGLSNSQKTGMSPFSAAALMGGD